MAGASVRVARTPVGIHVAAGAASVMVATVVAANLPASAGDWRLAPLAAALAVFAALTVDPAAAGAVAVLAYLLTIGFLVNEYGVLTWHGTADMYRLFEIAGSAGAGVALGALRRWSRQPSALTAPRAWRSAVVGASTPLAFTMRKEDHGV